MTAEIVIMNREAIALAADSAVTTTGETGQKIFTSANKIFTLSKYYPVGIMIYGSASFMGVPWETVIKIYREMELGKNALGTLREYVDDFIAFVDNGNPLFPDSVQQDYLHSSIYSYLVFIRESIKDKIHMEIDEKGKITGKAVKQILSQTIEEHYVKWIKTKNVPSIPESFNKDIKTKYGEAIDKAIEEVFEELPISKVNSNRLRKIAASLFSKFPEDIEKENLSGIVIVGFGEKEAFPSAYSFRIEAEVENKLKYEEESSVTIDFETGATIRPFAQREMVITFMEGIDPVLEDYIGKNLALIFERYPEILVDSMEKYDDIEKQSLKEKLREVSGEIFRDYQEDMQNYVRDHYINPVLRVVTILPKDELAVMAETLVNLTSFKRKVSLESETVGGPIDVALVSKGDGFVWIKRKHYFKAELNPPFFAKYYRGEVE